jgi:hemerythrin-like domain-containing protein
LTAGIESRAEWPPALRFLLERHPREGWAAHTAIGPLGRYWLARHASFREMGGALGTATTAFQDGRIEPAAFGAWFAPRLQAFLSHLDGHHQVEDYHYFPRLRALEPRLAAGFDVLAADHETIHRALIEVVEAANALLAGMRGTGGADQAPGDRYAAASARLIGGLMRHLDDEEDLIIPLLIERGEDALDAE